VKVTQLIFATGNNNKVIELNALLSELPYEIIKMADLGFDEDIPETGKTLEENAILKAEYLQKRIGGNIIAEDTGLEVTALGGAPGIYTARFAGPEKDPIQNMQLLLEKLKNRDDRTARFHAVICLIMNGEKYIFHGYSVGKIHSKMSGQKGFGYDPVFIPEGMEKTFAEMSLEDKSKISHRVRAFHAMHKFLTEQILP
jgi:XTP/dITP diphosphohydrolase